LLIDRHARSEGRALRLFTILLLILPIIFLTYVLFPIFGIFLRTGNHEYLAPLVNPKITSSILLSLQTAIASTVICMIMDVPLVYLIAWYESRFTAILRIPIMMPLAIPSPGGGALLVNIYGESSPLEILSEHLDIKLMQTRIGIILTQVFVILPFVVVTASAAIQRVDKHYEYAFRILDNNAALTFFRLPSRELASLAWIRAIRELDKNVMMAYNLKTISIHLWEYNALGEIKLVRSFNRYSIFVCFITVLVLGNRHRKKEKNTSRIDLGAHYKDD
jgi:ABC-type sulfate transport system permease component